MIDQQLINRINELARKKKTVGLTELERKEQQKLYKIYLGAIRGQVKQQLSNIRFVEDQQ
ncbi:DUF896 family protein [Laceyella sacchari]|jgi:uncharacterized protein YnzC (UPF0291/DUF896 family)|uniref:UPF0291 protein SAMN06265361_103122 n=2 Tax=Laceyella TaxID=292635 RepID=A0AA45WNC9_9BACL|nr:MULTISPECIES: DUF896 domain-containing protein [Laceyella]KPC71041.1 hypothetical protein ADL26_15820 [Thermoactinomyces vulgaris]AUS08934.1 DUF896 family protein [Laceyella sacchari]MRG27669.1 DUF896 domain-containing protein [Laceyella tengchongensis]TCW41665.1 uncharacterized protein YnzC (UPF0291/DUF896 family) [Laceyella sacchari]UWE02291.1 DUF896 domain-containing protein [Laceyella sacchari]